MPLSWPLNLAKSSSLVMGAKTASAVTGPLVPGVQAFAVSDERKRMRGDDLNVSALVGPAAAERAPRFEMDVGEFPLVHRIGGPFGGFLDIRRVGEARAVDIAQVADDFHDFGS